MKGIARLVLLQCGIFDPSMSALGPKADEMSPLGYVRFTPESGHCLKACVTAASCHYRELRGLLSRPYQQVDRLAAQRASERVEAPVSDRVAPVLIVLKRRKRHADGGSKLALSQATAAADFREPNTDLRIDVFTHSGDPCRCVRGQRQYSRREPKTLQPIETIAFSSP